MFTSTDSAWQAHSSKVSQSVVLQVPYLEYCSVELITGRLLSKELKKKLGTDP